MYRSFSFLITLSLLLASCTPTEEQIARTDKELADQIEGQKYRQWQFFDQWLALIPGGMAIVLVGFVRPAPKAVLVAVAIPLWRASTTATGFACRVRARRAVTAVRQVTCTSKSASSRTRSSSAKVPIFPARCR